MGADGAGKETAAWALPEPQPAPSLARLPSYPWLVAGAVCIGAFIGQVDASIIQLALPTLETAFDAPIDAVSWVAIAYVLAFACALPVFARLAEIAGRKALYLSGFALFGLWSAFCGFAPDLKWMIAFRLLQGASGAMLGANSLVILVAAAGKERRAKALGIMAAAQAVGLALGPTAGGVLMGTLGWRWIFWVTVPFAAVGCVLGWLIVPVTKALSRDRRFDRLGALLLTPALGGLLLALTEWRAWNLRALFACVVASLALLAGFAWREAHAPDPLIDLRLFRTPAFSAGGVGVLISYALLYGVFFAMSFALVRGYHDPAIAAGLRMTIVPAALGVVAPFAGMLSEARPRAVMVSGMALCALSALALMKALNGSPGSLPMVMAALAGYGAGLGCFIAPNNNATMAAAPAEKSGTAGGLLNLLRVFGTGFGVALAASVLHWGLERSGAPGGRTAGVSESALLAAVGDVLVVLATMAVTAGAIALVSGASPARALKRSPA